MPEQFFTAGPCPSGDLSKRVGGQVPPLLPIPISPGKVQLVCLSERLQEDTSDPLLPGILELTPPHSNVCVRILECDQFAHSVSTWVCVTVVLRLVSGWKDSEFPDDLLLGRLMGSHPDM